ncbi:MAG: hypothetical protein E6J42_03795 [Chloroflexi bacterium]|nr:MAG: hypothetical protein E6J42_03795 [Chloroflexota bacterium]
MISAAALPYTLLILFVELTVGALWVLWVAHLRGKSAASFIKFAAASIFVLASLSFWIAAKLHVGRDVDGYPLDPDYMPAARGAVLLVFVLSLPYAFFTLRESRRAALVAGGAASLAGVAALAFLAQVFAIPTWGYAGTLLSMIVGGLVVGAVSMGMVLGHWYLVTPRLPEQPLREMTFFLLVAMGVQALLLVPALVLPRDSIANAVDTPILQNPFFWMRVGGGLAFPMVLTWMEYDSSGVRAMQSATGLLYLAMALVLAGEVLAKGLLFVSAVPS